MVIVREKHMILFDNRPYTLDRVVRLLLGGLAIVGLIWMLSYLSDVLIPFAIAFLLAYLFNPLVLKLQRLGIRNRLAAVLLTLLMVLCAFTAAGIIVIPMIIRETTQMSALIGDIIAGRGPGMKNTPPSKQAPQPDQESSTPPQERDTDKTSTKDDIAQDGFHIPQSITDILPQETWNEIREFLRSAQLQEYLKSDSFVNLLKDGVARIIPIGRGLFSGVISIVIAATGVLVILLYLIFLMLDFQRVRKDWHKLIPPAYRQTVLSFVQDFDTGMNRYFRAQATIAACVGVITATGFYLIGLPMGILLGILVGILNMVPYLQIVAFVPALILAIAQSLQTGQSIWTVLLLVIVVFAVAQAIQDLLLTPRIMGEVTGLSPALMILSLSIWGKLLGILGLLIALPMTCLLLAYYKRLLQNTGDMQNDDNSSTPALPALPPEDGNATATTALQPNGNGNK